MLTQNLGHPRIGATRKLKTFSDLYSSGTGNEQELYQPQFQQRKIHSPIQVDCPNDTFTRTCILLSAPSPHLRAAEGTVLKAAIVFPHDISRPQQTILCWLEHLTFPNQINRGHFPSARC